MCVVVMGFTVCNLNPGLVQIEREGLLLTQINPSHQTAPVMSDLQLSWKRKSTTGQTDVEVFCLLASECSAPASMTFVRIKVRCSKVVAVVTVSKEDPDYMDHLSPEHDSNYLQQDTERAIAAAAAEEKDTSPEALLNAVCTRVTKQTLHTLFMPVGM